MGLASFSVWQHARIMKAATTATRNKNKFQVLAEIRQMATEVARCRNPTQRKGLGKNQESQTGS